MESAGGETCSPSLPATVSGGQNDDGGSYRALASWCESADSLSLDSVCARVLSYLLGRLSLIGDTGTWVVLRRGGREEALDLAGREPPDLALVDLSLGNALELLEDLSARKIPVLVCSMREEPSYVRRAMAAVARGYITKTEAAEQLARAVRDVLEGWMLISPRAAEGLR